ncbi:hypothetical protein Tco_0485059 [Tanacetum coccineum]
MMRSRRCLIKEMKKIDEHVEVGKDDDQEETEMKKHIKIVKNNEVAIDAIPLATKPPVIVKYKIVKEGKFVYFQLLSVDGSSKRYLSMIKMLQNIDREDLETLWKLVKAKHGNTRPEDEYVRVLWGDTKIQKMNIKFMGGLLGLKDFKMILRVTTAQERVKSILLLAIPDEYLLKFHNVADAKSSWEGYIKSRLVITETDKSIGRFMMLHFKGRTSTRSSLDAFFFMESDCLIMRNKWDIDEIDIGYFTTIFRVYEDEFEKVLQVPTLLLRIWLFSPFLNNTGQYNGTYSFLCTTNNQILNLRTWWIFSRCDGDDLEELDLRGTVAMLTVRGKKFIQRKGRNMEYHRKMDMFFDKSKLSVTMSQKKGHFAKDVIWKDSKNEDIYGDNARNNVQQNDSFHKHGG